MWYCYRRDLIHPLFDLQVGKWYRGARPPAEEHSIPTVYLLVDGEEVRAPLRDLIKRETKAGYAYAYRPHRMSQMEPGEPFLPTEGGCLCVPRAMRGRVEF